MNDHEFDALFKKAADNLEVPYNPKGWKRMQVRLNKASGNSLFRKTLWGFATLLLLLSVGWWLSLTSLIGAQQPQPIELSVAHKVNVKVLPPLPKVSKLSESIPSVSEDQRLEANKKAENSKVLNKVGQADHSRNDESAKVNKVIHDPSLTGISIASIHKPDEIHLMQGLGIEQERWIMPVWSIGQINIQGLVSSPEEVIKTKKSSAINRWGISLGISPDLSGVGLQGTHLSTNAAVLMEFFAWPKVSINSGVLFSNKVYGAAPEDYHPTYQYKNTPTFINGQCKVLDIPINIRWYALNSEKDRFFVSSGLSSYLMLSEDYEYVYEKNGSSYSRDYGYKNENNHLFKVANFSLGYERTLGKQWAVQVEPFVKLPLTGVGEGKIKLSTLGTFLSLHYRWGRR